jgi:Dolichyl-phosphate-mannose-protein mannosyltransferase
MPFAAVSQRGEIPKLAAHALAAAVCGAALRLVLIWRYPYHDSGDTPIYEELARNWLHRGVYGLTVGGRLEAVDIRMPGYPAFLAAVYRVFGDSPVPVMIGQAFVDLAACACVAALAALLAPASSRLRVAIAALWLAALCPFTANYTATVLTETLATALTAVALLLLVLHEIRPSDAASLGAGFAVGLCTAVRPESPLLLIAAALVRLARWGQATTRHATLRFVVLAAIGSSIPLAPWALRNALALHELRMLAPRYSELPGETPPRGFFAWTSTWLWRFDEVQAVSWKMDGEAIRPEDVPNRAFDSTAEQERIASLLAEYDQTRKMTPAVDAGFGAIAAERTARAPLRSYVTIPSRRVWTLWMTPRVDMLPAAEFLWPIGAAWENDPEGFSLTVGCAVINVLYLATATAGAWLAARRPGATLLVSFVLVRTAFLATAALAPEPRYTLECFPAIIALAAQLWSRPPIHR